MAINITLESFEGPLDLLVQLVRRSEISVWEIRIQEICEQFVAYTRRLEAVDVDLAGDFLVMAATLMRIKARLLLPRPELEDDSPEEPELDEEEQLIARLLLYEGFREAAEQLELLAEKSAELYPRGQPEELAPQTQGDPLSGVTLITLAVMVQQALAELATPEMEISTEKYSLAGQMSHLRLQLAGSHHLGFRQLLSEKPSRLEIVVTFLAVLELVRMQEIKVLQNCAGEVLIFGREKDATV
jgi:segregation and condensation protein A